MRLITILMLALFQLLISCTGKHLISDPEYLSLVEKSFNERKLMASGRDSSLFSVFEANLSESQKEALKYLYAFMPLNDLADYNGDFFLANVDMSLLAKEESLWSREIPDHIFLHYVLPYRVNNENLDSFRIVYYKEISDRIKGLNISEAALEINHWCHEKVNYQPSDIRTSAPMSTILSARGRCGEESTFTVAALRTAGIPARQVYTPRWAHSDDNHAWVEVWIEGNWYYMGACEPEPVLDQGWFTEPASRAMMVHTKSFGAFFGNENIINRNKRFTEVNNLSKYALTKRIYVKVLDKDNNPVENAVVEYQLYNYAEFYPIAIVPTNENGISQLETGMGDLLIWAYSEDNFNFKKISVEDTDTLILNLNREASESYDLELDLNVPVLRSPLPVASGKLVEQNAIRIEEENAIQQKYIDSWIDDEKIISLASNLMIDEEKTLTIIRRSMGNYKEIISFLTNCPDSLRNLAVSLLEILPDKDLRDTKEYILSDHLINCSGIEAMIKENGYDIFLEYIINPRIANEMMIDWRAYLKHELAHAMLNGSVEISGIIRYIDDNIQIVNDENYYNTELTPKGVAELKLADNKSRSIFFVALSRSNGIPARLEPGTNTPQYYSENIWHDVYFSDQEKPSLGNGYLKLHSFDIEPIPEYYIHFTIARFEKGRYNTLEYDYNKRINEFNNELELPPGNYMLVTGKRINDSKILSDISFFNLGENEHKTIEVSLRKGPVVKVNYGNLDLTSIVSLIENNNASPEEITRHGTVTLWIEKDKEPSSHILNDLMLFKSEFDSWGGYFLFLTDSIGTNTAYFSNNQNRLPDKSVFGVDDKLSELTTTLKSLNIPKASLPYVFLTDNNGIILFYSAGYRIGIGEQILRNLQ